MNWRTENTEADTFEERDELFDMSVKAPSPSNGRVSRLSRFSFSSTFKLLLQSR